MLFLVNWASTEDAESFNEDGTDALDLASPVGDVVEAKTDLEAFQWAMKEATKEWEAEQMEDELGLVWGLPFSNEGRPAFDGNETLFVAAARGGLPFGVVGLRPIQIKGN